MWIDDLGDHKPAAACCLCRRHADTLTPPRNWELRDLRRSPAPRADRRLGPRRVGTDGRDDPRGTRSSVAEPGRDGSGPAEDARPRGRRSSSPRSTPARCSTRTSPLLSRAFHGAPLSAPGPDLRRAADGHDRDRGLSGLRGSGTLSARFRARAPDADAAPVTFRPLLAVRARWPSCRDGALRPRPGRRPSRPRDPDRGVGGRVQFRRPDGRRGRAISSRRCDAPRTRVRERDGIDHGRSGRGPGTARSSAEAHARRARCRRGRGAGRRRGRAGSASRGSCVEAYVDGG